MNRLIILFVSFIVLLSINVVAAPPCSPSDCSPACSIDCFCTGVRPGCYCDCGTGGGGGGGSCCLPGEEEIRCNVGNSDCFNCNEVWVKCIPKTGGGGSGPNTCYCTGTCNRDRCYVYDVTSNNCDANSIPACVEGFETIICPGWDTQCPGQYAVNDCQCVAQCGTEAKICCSGNVCNSGLGLYCSFGQNDVQDAGEVGFCCKTGQYWRSDINQCWAGTDQCTEKGYNIFSQPTWYFYGYEPYYGATGNYACCDKDGANSITRYGETGNFFLPIEVYY